MMQPVRQFVLFIFKAIFSSAFVFMFWLLPACNQATDLLPEHIIDYSLKKKLTGNAAEEYVNKLHFQSVTDAKTKIAFYEDEKGTPLTIYITFYSDSSSAATDYEKMTEKISPENSVFIGGKLIAVGERQVYRCYGMGQTHFVFVNGKQLFWVSVNTISAPDFIEKYLDVIG